jgi:hypothetical protein
MPPRSSRLNHSCLILLGSLCGVMLPLIARAETASWGRMIQHFKIDPKTGQESLTGSTENISDPAKNMLIQITRNNQNIEISRREFLMDSKGRVRRGAIRDGKKRLIATTEYGFDTYDRVAEERTFHSSGKLLRRLIFKYDAAGRRLPDKFFIINPKDPNGALVESKATSEEASPLLPVEKGQKELPGAGIPSLRGLEPTPPVTTTPAPTAPPQKSGGLKNLFKKKQ